MRDRVRRSPSAHLLGALVALLLALGSGGTAHDGAASGASAVVAAVGGQGPQAVLDLHAQPRIAGHPGKAAGPAVALGVILLLVRWRRSPRVRVPVAVAGRLALGSRAPPRLSTPA
jgi:hypothetical protein